MPTYEVNSINFSISSGEEIQKNSVAHITSTRLAPEKTDKTNVITSIKKALNGTDKSDEGSVGMYGTVYDPRMGTIENGKLCETCGGGVWDCPGHFGHINLNVAIPHPLYHKQILSFLKCFCQSPDCSRLLLLKEQIMLNGLNRFRGNRRFENILEKLEKVDVCSHCSSPQPDIKYTPTDGNFTMVHKKKSEKFAIVLSIDEIKKTFDNVLDEDIELLGFDPKLVRPSSFIMTVFPVIPPCARPPVISDGIMSDDDLTNQIIEIIKANNHLTEDGPVNETKIQKYSQSLRFRVLTFYNNSAGRAKHTTNGRPIKGLKERISGKEGQIRSAMMGKRVDFSGRTVIGADPTLRMGELGIPKEMCKILTIPVKVFKGNREEMEKLVNDGKVTHVIRKNPDGKNIRFNVSRYINFKGTPLKHGDVIIRSKSVTRKTSTGGSETVQTKERIVYNGKEILQIGDDIERNGRLLEDKDGNLLKIEYPCKRTYKLMVGDIVERQIEKGDYVLLNRQPTLHRGSMQAMKIVPMNHKTLRFNLAITAPFNADFDGDEMNIHVPQSLEAQAELKMISAAKHHMISAQASKPNMRIVQDSLLGAHRMTLSSARPMTKAQFMDVSMAIRQDSIQENQFTQTIINRLNHVKNILKEKGKPLKCFNGRALVSLILPNDFNYVVKNNGDPNEDTVKIYRGVMYEGALNKTVLGSTHQSVIQLLRKEYSPDVAAEFIDNIQFLTNKWLMIYGYSIGLDDCMPARGTTDINGDPEEITNIIQKCFMEAEGIQKTTTHEGIREVRTMAVLSKAKDVGLRMASESLHPDNKFVGTVKAGSKGDMTNIAQITGLLGQQSLHDQRVPKQLNHGRRTLPHYPLTPMEPEDEYESRGFISSSFMRGLNPKEFYFHAMSGRKGVNDTATGTATSGYMQRRIVKLTEDITTRHDGTVRGVGGRIYQLAYGEDGLDPVNTVNVNGSQEVCDVARLVERLNLNHELKTNK